MNELLFHTPWWLPTVIIAVGVIVFVSGNKRTNGGLRTIGMIVAGLGVLLAAVSFMVDTDVEQVEKRSRQLVEAAGQQDWKTVETLLASNAHFSFGDSARRDYGNRQAVLLGARGAAERTGLRSAWVGSVEPQAALGIITTPMRVYSDQEKVGGHQIPSDWQLSWEKIDGKWVVTGIRLMQVGNVSAEDILSVLPK